MNVRHQRWSAKKTRPSIRTAPMAFLAIAMAVGIVWDRFGWPWGTSAWLILAIGASLVVLVRNGRGLVSLLALFLAVLALGGSHHHQRWFDRPPDDLSQWITEKPRPAWLRGVITTMPVHRASTQSVWPNDQGYSRFVMDLSAFCDGQDWHQASGRVQVTVGGDCSDFQAGDPIEIAGKLRLVAGPLNPGQHDPRRYLRSRGIRMRLSVDDSAGLVPDPSGTPRAWLRRLGQARLWCQQQFLTHLEEQSAPMAMALVLGRRGQLDRRTDQAFKRSGLAHVLAVSGLHLGALVGGFWLVFQTLGLRHKQIAFLILFCVLIYALLIGDRPSVIRVTVMTVVICVAVLADLKAKPSNLLATAALLTLIYNPCYLFDIGWQLSFLAIGTILFGVVPIYDRLNKYRSASKDPLDTLERRLEDRWKRSVRRVLLVPPSMILTSALIWAVCLPLTLWRFQLVAPLGILLIVVMIPLITVGLTSGLLVLLFGYLPILSHVFASLCGLSLSIASQLVHGAESLSWGHFYLPSPPLVLVLTFYGFLALAAWASAVDWPLAIRRGCWSAVVVVCGLGAVFVLTPHRPPTPEAEVLAVGHGLAVVLQGPDGSACLYDCGRAGDPSVGRRIIAPALWARGIRRLETIVLSHADFDHYAALPDLLERFAVGRVLVPKDFEGPSNPHAQDALAEARARGIPIIECSAGQSLNLIPGLQAEVLHPPPGWLPDAPDNDRSLVIDLVRDNRHFLLTGDLDGAGTAELIAKPSPGFDAVLAPHHGGRTANPPWFYDWARPELVVVSQRRPQPGSRDALQEQFHEDFPLFRAWQTGSVRLRWLANGLEAQGFRDRPPRPLGESALEIVSRMTFPFLAFWNPQSMIFKIMLTIFCFGFGLAWCAVLVVVDWGAWALVMPGRRQANAWNPPSTWRSVAIDDGDGTRLQGWWRSAADGGNRLAVVLHGFAETGSAMLDRGSFLHQQGWNVLVPDNRGSGRSNGDRLTFGARESNDLRRWLDAASGWLSGRPTVLIWGRSMGAAIAVRAAGQDPRIGALVLEAPYDDLHRIIRDRLRRWPILGASVLTGWMLAKASKLAGHRLDRPRPLDDAGQIQQPTLILYGTADRLVRRADIDRLAQAFPVDSTPLLIGVHDADHAEIFDRSDPAVRSMLADWLKRFAPAPSVETSGPEPSAP